MVILKYICQAPTVMMPEARFFLKPTAVAVAVEPRITWRLTEAAVEAQVGLG